MPEPAPNHAGIHILEIMHMRCSPLALCSAFEGTRRLVPWQAFLRFKHALRLPVSALRCVIVTICSIVFLYAAVTVTAASTVEPTGGRATRPLGPAARFLLCTSAEPCVLLINSSRLLLRKNSRSRVVCATPRGLACVPSLEKRCGSNCHAARASSPGPRGTDVY